MSSRNRQGGIESQNEGTNSRFVLSLTSMLPALSPHLVNWHSWMSLTSPSLKFVLHMGLEHILPFYLPPLTFSVCFARPASSSCGWKSSGLGALTSSLGKLFGLCFYHDPVCLPESSQGGILSEKPDWSHPLFKISSGFQSHLQWNTSSYSVLRGSAWSAFSLLSGLIFFTCPSSILSSHTEPLVFSKYVIYIPISGPLCLLFALPRNCLLQKVKDCFGDLGFSLNVPDQRSLPCIPYLQQYPCTTYPT